MANITYPIYFIGMPLSGKTTIAKEIANELALPFIDLDSEIEKNAHMFIDDIFESHGEAYFRQLETETLHVLKGQEAVIACGGGIVLNKTHKSIMHQGHVIHIMSDLEVLKARQKNSYLRPILLNKTLERLMDERFLKYQDFAHVHFQNDDDLKITINTILQYLKEQLK
jgi:shikimate kinase